MRNLCIEFDDGVDAFALACIHHTSPVDTFGSKEAFVPLLQYTLDNETLKIVTFLCRVALVEHQGSTLQSFHRAR